MNNSELQNCLSMARFLDMEVPAHVRTPISTSCSRNRLVNIRRPPSVIEQVPSSNTSCPRDLSLGRPCGGVGVTNGCARVVTASPEGKAPFVSRPAIPS
jgi:hypothetical protein